MLTPKTYYDADNETAISELKCALMAITYEKPWKETTTSKGFEDGFTDAMNRIMDIFENRFGG